MCGVEFLKFDLQSMKTMKYILLIICVACVSTMMAVDYKVHQQLRLRALLLSNSIAVVVTVLHLHQLQCIVYLQWSSAQLPSCLL